MQHQISLSEATNIRLRAEVEQNHNLVTAVSRQLQERQAEQERKQRSHKALQLLTELLPEIIQDLAR
jgi:hypothetical protein